MGKLRKGDISLLEFYKLSKSLYGNKVDNKEKRVKLDITSAKVNIIKNFTYDKSQGIWKSTNKRSVKFEFIVSSKPVSYKRTDKIAIHKYPVTIVMFDIEQGMSSAFRYRSGSLKKPIFAPKGCGTEKAKKIGEQNIRNGVDMFFVFSLEAVLSAYNLLHGPNYTNKMPNKVNKNYEVYFEKHSLYIIEHVLMKIFSNPMSLSKLKKMVFKNGDNIGPF
jgi:hypothetical protein